VLVFRDFSEHKAAERALLQAKTELEGASQAKDRFLAALSHELRTPLTPLLATLSSWEVNPDFPEGFRNDVRMLCRNVEFEARLIDDLLDLTRIAKGKMHFHRRETDLNEVVRAAAAVIGEEIRAKGLEFRLNLHAAAHHVFADATRLQQVLLNLLKNAAKFTLSGQITLSTENDEAGRICITVSDTGIGMAPELIGKLFHYFEQGSETVTKRFGGLGLGLAISHSLVEAHDGTLEAASAGEGSGSSFTITLPSIAPSTSLSTSLPAGAADGAPVFHMSPMRILLVEDHVDTLQILQRLLGRAGHTVQGVSTITAAGALLSTEPFDLLISDLGLPDGSGLELIRTARPGFAKPAIALSGYGLEEDVSRCREAGFNAHLTKPVNLDSLNRLLARLAAGSAEDWHGESALPEEKR
jgi:hypothetical protein